jgi:succinate--hydroxymethylglutarate CoA-transferase
MGLGYKVASKINDRLVYASITGYGQTGPYATAAGYDAVLGGEAGGVHCTGEADQVPVRPMYAVSDHTAGYNAFGSILAALIARQESNKGVHLDVSMFDCSVGFAF